jgi:hypothetical protein
MFEDAFGRRWGPRWWRLFFALAVLAASAFFLGEIGGFGRAIYSTVVEVLRPTKELPPPQTPHPPPTSASSERVIVDVSPQTLMNFYKGRTGLEAQRLLAPYLGKWTNLTGNIDDIQQAPSRGVQIQFKLSPYSEAILIFDSDWLDRLSVLPPHASISALCQIDTVGVSGASFVHCQLTD